MIIKFPTGLYKSILPSKGSSGNITYTISNNSPPRPFINVSKLPIIDEVSTNPPKVHDDITLREQFGSLIYSVAKSNNNITGSNTKMFEVGEVLSFDNLVPVDEVVNVKSPENIELRHDTNLLDLEGLGLTKDEINDLVIKSQIKLSQLEKDFMLKQDEIKKYEVEIVELQKKINENNKTLNAVIKILGLNDGEVSDDVVYQKLIKNKTELNDKLSIAISNRNNAATQITSIVADINRISELVR